MAEIEGRRLTTYTVTSDGKHFSLNFTDSDGRPAVLTLPTECLNELLMTLPRMISQAMRARYHDNSLRVVFPAEEWQLAHGEDSRLILTIGTGGGFEASFAFDRDQLRVIADSVKEEAANGKRQRSLN